MASSSCSYSSSSSFTVTITVEEYGQLCTEVVEPVKADAAGLKNAVRVKANPWLDYCTAEALTVIYTTKTKIAKGKAAKPFLDPADPLCMVIRMR